MLNFRAPVRGGSGMLGGPEAPTQTAVYGPVRTVVWQGSVGDHRPYADLVVIRVLIRIAAFAVKTPIAERTLVGSTWNGSMQWKSSKFSHISGGPVPQGFPG